MKRLLQKRTLGVLVWPLKAARLIMLHRITERSSTSLTTEVSLTFTSAQAAQAMIVAMQPVTLFKFET